MTEKEIIEKLRKSAKMAVMDMIANEHKPTPTFLEDWAKGIAADIEQIDDMKAKLKAFEQENKDLTKLLCARDETIRVEEDAQAELRRHARIQEEKLIALRQKLEAKEATAIEKDEMLEHRNKRIKELKRMNEAERAHSCHLVVEKNNEINLFKDRIKELEDSKHLHAQNAAKAHEKIEWQEQALKEADTHMETLERANHELALANLKLHKLRRQDAHKQNLDCLVHAALTGARGADQQRIAHEVMEMGRRLLLGLDSAMHAKRHGKAMRKKKP